MGVKRARVWKIDDGEPDPWVVFVMGEDWLRKSETDFPTHAEALAWADEQVYGPVRTWEHVAWGRIRGQVLSRSSGSPGAVLTIRLAEGVSATGRWSCENIDAKRGGTIKLLAQRMTEVKETR